MAVGTDHAGIATQMVVERQLASGTNDMKWGERHSSTKSGTGKKNWRDYYSSSDVWVPAGLVQERFTMDPQLSQVVEKVFIDLEEG